MSQTRYSQPFTLSEAIRLDVDIINEEITRLQDSLRRLRETQDFLKEHLEISENKDPELVRALQENETTIGSQDERIELLKHALREKGVLNNGHYDIPLNGIQPLAAPQTLNGESHDQTTEDGEGGLHL